MAVKNLELPIFHFDDPVTGLPLDGGKVYVYAAGTTTSINTWEDFDQETVNANPVVLDSYGNAKIWFDQTAKIIVKSSDDTTTYFTFDDVSPVGGTSVITGEYNLCQNGSFESFNTDNTPTQWTASLYDPTASITVDTTNVTHGQYSVKFDGQTGLGCGILTSQRFDVNAGSMLSVSLDTMASNATTTNDAIVYWYQKDDTTASATASTTLTLPAEGSYPTSMTNYNFMVSVPSDATRAEIRLTGIDSGGSNLDADCYFDNVLIKDTGPLLLTNISSPATSMSVSSLVLPADREIEFDAFVVVTATAGVFELLLNGDTTLTNYYTSYSLNSAAATQANNNSVGVASNNGTYLHLHGVISPNSTADKSLVTISGAYWNTTAVSNVATSIYYTQSSTITSIGFREATASATVFGAGSRLKVKVIE